MLVLKFLTQGNVLRIVCERDVNKRRSSNHDRKEMSDSLVSPCFVLILMLTMNSLFDAVRKLAQVIGPLRIFINCDFIVLCIEYLFVERYFTSAKLLNHSNTLQVGSPDLLRTHRSSFLQSFVVCCLMTSCETFYVIDHIGHRLSEAVMNHAKKLF